MKAEECVLFSGAANGAESEFGAAAERRDIDEVNFTFAGHNDARHRGIRVLTHEELEQGDVSGESPTREPVGVGCQEPLRHAAACELFRQRHDSRVLWMTLATQ